MFRREREFNIISGETTALPNQRTSSNIEKIRRFENADQPSIHRTERLGYSKDRKQYQYSYESLPKQSKIPFDASSLQNSILPVTSMLNSVSTAYNIVNLKSQHPTSRVISSDIFNEKLPEVNRKSPLTTHIQAGRLFAPNYHPDYAEKVAGNQFLRKKGLCDSICDNQKTYGMAYFRVLK